MDEMIRVISERLRGLREILDLSTADMAAATDMNEAEYLALESGQRDFSFTFLYKAAHRFGVDLTDLLTGESPHLSGYALVRNGSGLPINRRKGFMYLNLAYTFKDRLAEPFMVTAPYEPNAEQADIVLSTHTGQEMDYIISGKLRVRIEEHEEILEQGDTLYYNAGKPHGMVAVGGQSCQFLALVINASAHEA